MLIPGGQAGAAFNRLDVNKLVDAFRDEPADAAITPAPAAAAESK